MKLLELKLFDNYKTIKKGTTFKFKAKDILCVAGQNGSGKTNLFSIISEILSVTSFNNKKIRLEYKFELKIELKGENFKITNVDEEIVVYRLVDMKRLIGGRDYIRNNLNVILYSSAKRTILGEPHYVEILEKIKDKKTNESSFNYLIREKLKKCILIYLFLFEYDEMKKLVDNIIPIKELEGIVLEIKLDSREGIDNEQRKAVRIIFGKTYKEMEDGVQVYLEKDDLERIKNYYSDNKFHCFLLLESLEKLNFMNMSKQKELINYYDGIIGEKIEDNYLSDKFFISNIFFEEDIEYKFLSEGEVQLLETLGSILLFQSKEYQKENLYIFDEPTTHLNANWMSKYITLLKNVLLIKSANESKLMSQLIFSTHNSEIITDLPMDNLHLIENGEFKTIKEETFGSSEFKLNKILFNKTSSVSENVLNEINKYYEKIEGATSKEDIEILEEYIEMTFAESPEKYKLLRYAQNKLLKIEERV